MQQITVEYMGVAGTGRTVSEAKENARKTIAERLAGDYHPELIRHESFFAFVWRDPANGWGYRIFDADDKPGMVFANTLGHQYDRIDAINACRKHLAQMVYRDAQHTGAEVIKDKNDLAQHMDWVHWQEAYKAAIREGKSDQEAFRYATERKYA